MPEYPTLEATADDVAARAYKGSVCWALREVERVEAHVARTMAAGGTEAWYLPYLRSELTHVRVFLAVLVGANSNLNHFTVDGDGWVAALRALLSEEPAVKPCHCDVSTARDGHIHEANGSVLCLHYEGEDGADCPQRKIRDASETGEGFHGEGEFDLHYDPACPRCTAQRDRLRPPDDMDQVYAAVEDDGRCPHGYFRSGAGSCPMCSA